MLDAHAHGEGLGLHGKAQAVEHLEGIPGAVTDGEDGVVTVDDLAALQLQPRQLSAFAADARHLAVEADLAAKPDDGVPQILDHRQQHIGAHMGLGVIEDVLPGAAFDELLQDPADSGIVDAGVQLAVGEGPRAALAELDIASWIQLSGGEKVFNLGIAAGGVLAPFQHQGPKPRPGQDQGSEHARGAEAHHHRALGRGHIAFGDLIIGNGGHRSPLAAGLADQLLLIAIDHHIDGVDDLDIRLFPGVHAALYELEPPDLGRGDPQELGRLELELADVMLRRQGNIPNSDHNVSLPADSPARRPELHAHCRLWPPQSPSISSTSPQA